jgi:hypothetical protein
MPLPKPKPKEDQATFIGHCMGSSVMEREFPNNKQRLAVCYSQYRKFRGKKTKKRKKKR